MAVCAEKNALWGKNLEASGRKLSEDPPALDLAVENDGYGYETAMGRACWPSPDPIGERGGVNLYWIVGNNAVNSIDYQGWFELDTRNWGGAIGPEGCPGVNMGSSWFILVRDAVKTGLDNYGHKNSSVEADRVAKQWQSEIGFLDGNPYQGDVSIYGHWSAWTRDAINSDPSCRWRARYVIEVRVLYFTNYFQSKSVFNADPRRIYSFQRIPDSSPEIFPPPTNPVNPELPAQPTILPDNLTSAQQMKWVKDKKKIFEYLIDPKVSGRESTKHESETDTPDSPLHFRFDSK